MPAKPGYWLPVVAAIEFLLGLLGEAHRPGHVGRPPPFQNQADDVALLHGSLRVMLGGGRSAARNARGDGVARFSALARGRLAVHCSDSRGVGMIRLHRPNYGGTIAECFESFMTGPLMVEVVEVDPGIIAEAVRRIVGVVDPLKVVLFGSRARGDARPDSDFDLLVIRESDQRRD